MAQRQLQHGETDGVSLSYAPCFHHAGTLIYDRRRQLCETLAPAPLNPIIRCPGRREGGRAVGDHMHRPMAAVRTKKITRLTRARSQGRGQPSERRSGGTSQRWGRRRSFHRASIMSHSRRSRQVHSQGGHLMAHLPAMPLLNQGKDRYQVYQRSTKFRVREKKHEKSSMCIQQSSGHGAA